MEFSAKTIASLLGGTLEGNPDVAVSNISKIEEGRPGTLSFLANHKYIKYLYTTEASVVLINNDYVLEKPVQCTLIRVENAYESFAKLMEFYNEQTKVKLVGIDKNTSIDSTAKIGNNVYIGPFSVIGRNVIIEDNVIIHPQVYVGDNVAIKANTTLFSGVKIYHNCKIGSNCILHSGVIVGSDGFGFAPQEEGTYKKIPQLGNVVIEDYVEVGSNTTIDRATMGSTILHRGVKLDNLIQIAHNVEIGENTVIAALTGVSGSAKIGRDCMIGGQVGIVGHITIADEVKIGAKAGIAGNIKEVGSVWLGAPAFHITDYQKSYYVFKQLPEINRQVSQLQRELNALKEELERKKK